MAYRSEGYRHAAYASTLLYEIVRLFWLVTYPDTIRGSVGLEGKELPMSVGLAGIDFLLTRLVYVGGVVNLGWALTARSMTTEVPNVVYCCPLGYRPVIVPSFNSAFGRALVSILITVEFIINRFIFGFQANGPRFYHRHPQIWPQPLWKIYITVIFDLSNCLWILSLGYFAYSNVFFSHMAFTGALWFYYWSLLRALLG